MRTTIFLISLVCMSAYAGHLENIFKEAADTEYGRTLISTIQLQMESGEQVDGLIESMGAVVDGLKDQMAGAQAMADAKQTSCSDDRYTLSSALNQAQADADKLATASQFDSATLASRVEEKANKEGSLAARRSMLATLTAQRDAERESYERIKAEYESVFAVVEDCRSIMQSRLVAGSFLETKTSIQSAVLLRIQKFKTPAQGVAHGYGAFIRLMASILERSADVQADQSIVQRLFDILDRVEENLVIASSTEREADRTRQEDFEELEEKLGGQINYVLGQLVVLRATISTLTDRVAMAQEKREIALTSVVDYQVRLDDRNAACASEQAVWEVFYNTMSAELSTAGKMMYLLEDKRALLARYGL